MTRLSCCLVGVWLMVLLCWNAAHAATLDVPAPHTVMSGLGVIHGWKCKAGELTVRFNGGPPIPLLHGAERKDVRDAGACAHANAGFVTIWNWSNLGDGYHTAVVYDDGVESDRARFHIVTTGEAPLAYAAAECIAEDFPLPGDQSRFIWNNATQHMELTEVREWYDGTDTPGHPMSADFDFLLERDSGRADGGWGTMCRSGPRRAWKIEVPDLLAWQYISQWEHPEWETLDPDNGGRGGNRFVAGPADIEFIRYEHGLTSNKNYPFSAIPPWGISLVGEMTGTQVSHIDRRGNPVLKCGLPHAIEIGTLANGLPWRTREAIGEVEDGYSMVVPMSTPDTTQGNRCFILVFDDFHRTPDGGMETQARFYRTARTPSVLGEPRYCVPPIYPGGINGKAVPQVSKPHAVTRVRIYWSGND